MDLTIVAVYTICDDLLISLGHREHPQTQMTDAEVMTTAPRCGEILRRQSAKRMRCFENTRIYSEHVRTLAL